jgi:hypothetical protein
MTVKEAPAPQPAEVTQGSSMFDNMSLKQQEPKEDLSTSMPTGSAFGFINQTPSNDTSEKKENAPSLNSRDLFDPLKNMTPTTAKQMMQLSPQQQMQAMAYQQMMMQQQMQMSHMMAMQQQRGSGGIFMPMPAAGNRSGHPVMQNPAAAKTAFAFMDQPRKEETHSFDFIKDTMTMEKKK